MNSTILQEVRSPFTDELIQELIEKYISCGCDKNLLYNEINALESNESSIDPSIRALINKIYSEAINLGDYREDNSQLIYDTKNSWVILYSEADPMKDKQRNADGKQSLIYRIYLNLKGKEKSVFIEDYIRRCQETQIPFKFKFSKDDSRNDQIVILSRSENFEENVSIIEELTSNLQLGKLPMLIGEYKGGIGIAEEYYSRLYSPTEIKLALVGTSVKKYLCDHKDEFYEQLSEEDKAKINDMLYYFEFGYSREKRRIEEKGEKYNDIRKRYYQRKSTIDRIKEHIENYDETHYFNLQELSSVIQQIYSNNPEQFIHEVTQNYRMIGTEVWGFSQDFVFSNETEERFLKPKEVETPLSAKQIASELEAISRKGLETQVQSELIRIAEEKEEEKGIEQ